MTLRAGLIVVAVAALLGGCMDVDLFGDDDSDQASTGACTAQSCPQAQQFCTARGYTAGTPAFDRCLVSVEENLRKESR